MERLSDVWDNLLVSASALRESIQCTPHLGDPPAHIDAQDRVSDEFGRPAAWAAKAILNVARIGTRSSDRTLREYARDVWRVARVEE